MQTKNDPVKKLLEKETNKQDIDLHENVQNRKKQNYKHHNHKQRC